MTENELFEALLDDDFRERFTESMREALVSRRVIPMDRRIKLDTSNIADEQGKDTDIQTSGG